LKADLSRDTFEQTRHYLRVLSQQGRVYVDADTNEQTSILLHHLHTVSRDVIGPHGGPEDDLGFTLTLEDGELLVAPGRYYVDGILCEVEPPPAPDEVAAPNAISYYEQPDYPVDRDDDLPRATFLAYLDVWERHVTAIDDGHIREVALGGPDTATRSQIVWQVKIADELSGRPLNFKTRAQLEKNWSKFVTTFRPESGSLAAGTGDPVDETDPCITPPAAGFRGPENQLYRVEIVTPGTADDDATFVWSRENGSVLSGWDQEGNRLTLADPGRDRKLGFEPGHWVELTDDVHELTGVPGTFARVTRVEAGALTVDEDTATGPLDPATFPGIQSSVAGTRTAYSP
jgi:Family of unknown function (DUF6519)